MRKLIGAVIVSLWMPAVALAATWENVSLVDTMCADKVKANPDKHTTSCLLKCADSGYGIQTSDGKFIKLDDAGKKLAISELKKTKKADHVRVNVTGEQKGDVIHVASLKMAE
jgi:hypothetical protein